MDFEERIEKLTARHEALSQTVELLAHAQTRNEQIQAKNEKMLTQVIESIDSLSRIAHAHEKRISDIEDRPQ